MNKSLLKTQKHHKTVQKTATRHTTPHLISKTKRKVPKRTILSTQHQPFSSKPDPAKTPEVEEEPELEIITKSVPPPRRQHAPRAVVQPVSSPKTQPQTPQQPKLFNVALPHTEIPPEGHVIFEHKARGWLQIIPPAAAVAGVGFPTMAAMAIHATNYSPDVMTVFGCAAASAIFAAYQAYRFSQKHVHLMRLMPDNVIQFETLGFFGFKRFVSYPANFIYPIMVDPHHGMFGYRVKFFPLLQDMEQNPGNLTVYDSGLVVAPDVNFRGGPEGQCWNHLLTGGKSFGQTDQIDSKRKAVSMI